MNLLQQLITGASIAFLPMNLVIVVAGTAVGIIFGSLPGLTATMGIALFIPVTFAMDATTGLILLGGVYTGAMYGGSISAILIHAPGTPAAAATAFDGYEMTKKGQAGKALTIATMSSFVGGVVGAVLLLLLAPPLARFSLRFGPAEYFAVAIFGLTIISSLTSDSINKGLISGIVGVILGTVGMHPVTGQARLTFGQLALLEGIPIVPALIGLFSVSQIIIMAEEIRKENKTNVILDNKIWFNFREIISYWKEMLSCSVLGTFIGLIPGAGGDIASFVAYNEVKRFSKDKESFGKGNPLGVVAAESANNGVTGGSLIPLLTLGIPGNSVTAVFLGGLIIQGLRPGPQLFAEQGSITYAFIIGLILAKFCLLILGLPGSKIYQKILDVPKGILMPVIFALCAVGSYALRNNLFDVYLMFGFGIMGYFFRKNGLHPAPVILGIILGPIAERNFHRLLTITESPIAFTLSQPIALILIIFSVLSIFSPIFLNKLTSYE